MKTTLVCLLLFAGCLLSLRADATNTLVVVSTTAQLDLIKLANDIDNYRRTNGLAPYLAPTNALNLRSFAESIAATAIAERALSYVQEDDGKLYDAVRRATAIQRANARQQLPP